VSGQSDLEFVQLLLSVPDSRSNCIHSENNDDSEHFCASPELICSANSLHPSLNCYSFYTIKHIFIEPIFLPISSRQTRRLTLGQKVGDQWRIKGVILPSRKFQILHYMQDSYWHLSNACMNLAYNARKSPGFHAWTSSF